ncbi:hypothetical protein AVEN_189781-1 [Araneus ventricosus]|uniref:Tc1-like transposase DDE domain-containing protein n=1 Tax=Araneus ventricosus TaxID=182803 RepID=A0A4Y2QMN5_ARAVE|nr:hypothetical protein AVEN_189781-1 [Araneus ventricosus]
MDWPAYSPDLNPIEHEWDVLGRRIAARQPPSTCLPELRRALLDDWCNIPQDQIDNLILSMPRRSPLKPGVFGRKRHELDSPNLGGHLPRHSTLYYNLLLRRTEMGCGWQGQLYLLPHLSPKRPQNFTSPQMKTTASDRPSSLLREIFRPPGTASSV